MHVFFGDAATPFMLNDMGADPLMTGGANNPYLFSNSFNLWQSMYALGDWAARHIGSKACVAAAFHEAGYGIVQAFWLGFSGAGGRVLGTEVTHRASADEDPSAQLRTLAALEPDFVMAFYSGREGIAFANAWSGLGLAGTLPLVASPLMTHGYWGPKLGDAVVGMRTAISWRLDSEEEEQTRFRKACNVSPGKEPAVFALLGYETGLMLREAIASIDGAPTRETLRDALTGVAFASPRGSMRMDPVTREVATVDYLHEIRRGPDGALAAVCREALPLPASFQTHYDAIKSSEERAGWFNPYLVT
jgi:branched-chain amino acid transport system substrate-binding protein